MVSLAEEIQPVNIEDELKQSYLDYAMSVIVGRALPDVRDGLKPVHRRVLYAMHELGNEWNKAYKKSARVVGDVIGKYHPHGDTAVYDAIVRMAQPFSMRYMLVDGQGNFGSIDGDMPAAMRYTEVRMAKIAHYLLADLDKDTVNFVPNYDESEMAPVVMPTQIPNLLINGAAGIAVGMATNIPPHNIGEVIDACLALIENPGLSIEELMQFVPGPDFPTAAMINGKAGIIEAYRTGRGRILIRSKAEIVDYEKGDKQAIIVTEIPYQVNKARLIERIAELVKEKKIEGISALRDESNKDGLRIVIEVKRSENAEVLLNNLYSQTQLQTVYGINMVALIDGQPKTLNLKQILDAFILHRRVVVNRRTLFELRKARERAHLLEGWSVALSNIDPVIALIKAAKTPQDAKVALQETLWNAGMVSGMLDKIDANKARPDWLTDRYGVIENNQYRFSEAQAQAILELRLHRLTGMEQEKIWQDYRDILVNIAEYIFILENPAKLMSVIAEELQEVKTQFTDARRTEIITSQQDLSHEDLIPEETKVVTLSRAGYVKSQPLDDYQAQHRGGRGKSATNVKELDVIESLLVANSHDNILCFSSKGKVYWLKVYQLPAGSRGARGRPMVNLLPLEPEERINAILPLKREKTTAQYIFMATAQGTVKKVRIEDFSRPRASGIIAVDLDPGDELIGAETTDGQQDILLFNSDGKAIRFHEDDVRPMGRTARGVRGIRLAENQKLISLLVVKPQGAVLVATEHGFGKRTPIEDFPVQGRGGQGVIGIQTSERNGRVVGAVQVETNDEMMLITDQGTLVRIRVEEVSLVSRNTQGVKLINLSAEESLVGIQVIKEEFGESSDQIANGSDA
jgi:DNA gyrase subunit A